MIKLLIRNRLLSAAASVMGKGKKNAKKDQTAPRVALFILLYLFLGACFAIVSVTMALGFATVFIPNGASTLYFSMFIIATFSVLFIFSIFETKSELFECRDNELLLSMPIRPIDIVISRISVVLIFNYIEELVVFGPAIVIYYLFSADIIGVIGAFIVFILIPPLATALASGVGYVVALIAKRIKNKSFIVMFLSVAFLIAYFYFVNILSESMEEVITLGETILVNLANAPVLMFIGNIVFFRPLSFIAFVILALIIPAFVFYLISKSYIGIVTDNRGTRRAVYDGKGSVKKSILSALTRKELSRFFSSATYMLNGGMGAILNVVIAILALVKRNDLIMMFSPEASGSLPLSDLSEILSPIMLGAAVLLQSMTMISASALSLEGKCLWIPKSMPISGRDSLLAKALMQVVVTLPMTLISSVLFAIASFADLKYWILFIFVPVAANIFFALFGIVINVAFPKFEYTNEVQVVKQSMSMFIVMTVQFILSGIVVALNTVLAILSLGIISSIITLGVFLALDVSFYFILTGPCVKRYSTFEP